MNKIKDKLTTSQKDTVSKTCFRVFLNITKFRSSLQLLHNLMYKIINIPSSSSDEMYFEISGNLFCYALRHFVMITGFNYDGDVNYKCYIPDFQ